MWRLSVLSGVLAIALLAIGLSATSASATILCETATNPCPSYYGGGTVLNAGGSTVLQSAAGEVKCQATVRGGKITNAGANGINVTGNLHRLEPEECKAIQVLKSGTFAISSPKEGNGVLTTEGLELTVESGGLHCIWAGSGSISFEGGESASMAGTIELTRVGGKSGVACGTEAEWTVEMRFGPIFLWGPEHIYVEEGPVPTVLCKTNSSPCSGGIYGKGTTIEASLKAGTKSVIHDTYAEIACAEAAIKGEVLSPAESGITVTGAVTALSIGNCNHTVTVLNKGSFAITVPSEGDGFLTLEGVEITTLTISAHCIWGGSVSIPLKGGEMASMGGTIELARIGGPSGIFCGSFVKWTVEYTVTVPEPLYVAES
jgi:hypothetical protein